MPLSFPSLSHGSIAFGFFNIDTDLLLLEHYFFFADLFCGHISRLSGYSGEKPVEETWDVHSIPDRAQIGDLMGAIHGIRYSGFIGDVYRRFPFPKTQAEFKQRPEGYRTRSVVEEIMGKYAERARMPFNAEPGPGTVKIGQYLFSAGAFQDLIQYVWLGGYPRWRDGVRPGYVLDMKNAVEESDFWLFAGLKLS